MVRIGATEFLEGTEEMVMPGITLGRDKTAHGEGVDQRIVELLVLIDGRGRNRILAASRRIARHALRLGEAARRRIDAELVVDRVPDQRLGEHGAVQMKMKLAPLRHALEEIVQRKRIAANIVERLGGAKLGLAGRLSRISRHRRGHGHKQEGDGDDGACDVHAVSHSTKTAAKVFRFQRGASPRFRSS
jgi:hypothetical protein